MIVELRSCSLDIKYIGTEEEISLEILKDSINAFSDSIVKIGNLITSCVNEISKFLDECYQIILRSICGGG